METLWRLFHSLVRFLVICMLMICALAWGGIGAFVFLIVCLVLLYSLQALINSFVDLHFRERHKRD